MAAMGTSLRNAVTGILLCGSLMQFSGVMVAEARVALQEDFAARDEGIMLGALAGRELKNVQIEDGDVNVGGSTVASIDNGPDGGTISTPGGTNIGYGPEGAGGELEDGSTGGVGDADGLGAGIQTSEGSGIGIGTDGAGAQTSGGVGIGVSEDGIKTNKIPSDDEPTDSNELADSDAPLGTDQDEDATEPSISEEDEDEEEVDATRSSSSTNEDSDEDSPSIVETDISGAAAHISDSYVRLAAAAAGLAVAVIAA